MDSHYSDLNFFCNLLFDLNWSIIYSTKICYVSSCASFFSQRKQLCCVRIDDHIKKSLNQQIDPSSLNSFLTSYKFSLKNVAFNHDYKPFAVCIAQHFPLALSWSYYR